MEVPSKNQKRSCSVNINSVKKFILTLSAHFSLPVIDKYECRAENQIYEAENQSRKADFLSTQSARSPTNRDQTTWKDS